MAFASARSRRDRATNYWPGFVDALSSLLLVIIFLLSLFMLAQFFLNQELLGKDTAMSRLTLGTVAARACQLGRPAIDNRHPLGHAVLDPVRKGLTRQPARRHRHR